MTSDSYFTTVGVHPTRARDPFKVMRDKETSEIIDDQRTQKEQLDDYFDKMKDFLDTKSKEKVIAIGECGLDYERLFCAEEDI